MGVDDDAFRSAEGITQNHVGRFAADSGQAGQSGQAPRHRAPVGGQKRLSAGLEVFGFGAKKTGGLDDGLEFGLGDLRVILRGAAALKQAARHLVDPHVGALCRKNGGDEELEWVGVIQLAVGLRVGLLELLYDPQGPAQKNR